MFFFFCTFCGSGWLGWGYGAGGGRGFVRVLINLLLIILGHLYGFYLLISSSTADVVILLPSAAYVLR